MGNILDFFHGSLPAEIRIHFLSYALHRTFLTWFLFNLFFFNLEHWENSCSISTYWRLHCQVKWGVPHGRDPRSPWMCWARWGAFPGYLLQKKSNFPRGVNKRLLWFLLPPSSPLPFIFSFLFFQLIFIEYLPSKKAYITPHINMYFLLAYLTWLSVL